LYTKVLSSYDPGIAKATADDFAAFQKRTVAKIKGAGVKQLIADGMRTTDSGEVPENQWPESIRALAPVRVLVSEGKVTVLLYRMAAWTDGVILSQEPGLPPEAPNTKHTDFGDGVVWFSSMN
jgi:hypothetical protein